MGNFMLLFLIHSDRSYMEYCYTSHSQLLCDLIFRIFLRKKFYKQIDQIDKRIVDSHCKNKITPYTISYSIHEFGYWIIYFT